MNTQFERNGSVVEFCTFPSVKRIVPYNTCQHETYRFHKTAFYKNPKINPKKFNI